MNKKLKIVLLVLIAVIICGLGIFVGKKIYEPKSSVFPIYSCEWKSNLSDKINNYYVIGREDMQKNKNEHESFNHIVSCKQIDVYSCKNSDCYVAYNSVSWDTSVIYDNGEEDGGFIIVDSKNGKIIEGPFIDIKYGYSNSKFAVKKQKDGKYAIYSYANPKNKFVSEYEFDNMLNNDIVIKDGKYGILSYDTDKHGLLKYNCEYDSIEYYNGDRIEYRFEKNGKYSFNGYYVNYYDNNFHDYINPVDFVRSDGGYSHIYLVYIDGNKLHFVDKDNDLINSISVEKISSYEEINSYMDYESNNIVVIINDKMYSLNLDSLKIEIKNYEPQNIG